MRTKPGDYEVIQMKCLRWPLHHQAWTTAFFFVFLLPLILFSIFLFCFIVFVLCVDCAQKNAEISFAENWKIYENYCGNESVFPSFIHFRL